MYRIVEVVPSLKVGGAETLIADYCKSINKEQIQLKVIVIDRQYFTPIEERIKESGVEVIYLGNQLFKDGDLRWNILKLIRFVSRYYYFNKAIHQYDPDVIHIHLHLGLYFRFLFMRKKDVRLYLTVHNVTERYFCKDCSNIKKYVEYREVCRLIRKKGLTLIALHEDMRQELKSFFDSERVILLRNGICLSKFDPSLYDKNEMRSRLGIEESAFVIGHVGRFHEQKNHRMIIDIFCNIYKKDPNSVLLLVGTGDLKEQIEEMIRVKGIVDRVIILSNRPDIPQIMCAMDVFLMPSLWEGYPVSLIEAQAMGIKCVISDAINTEAILSNRVIVVSLSGELGEWEKAIFAETGFAQKVSSIKDYDMNACISRLEDIYCNRA